MAANNHGTRQRYGAGCRCDECKSAQRTYQRRYRQRKSDGLTRPLVVAELPSGDSQESVQNWTPGPVELAVEAELHTLPAATSRPAMAAIAIAMAKILDGKVPTPKPAAAKVLVSVLDTLHKGSAQRRRGSLALVRTMTQKGDA